MSASLKDEAVYLRSIAEDIRAGTTGAGLASALEQVADRLIERYNEENEDQLSFCTMCQEWHPTESCHTHSSLGIVCDNCWDERLRE